MENSIILGDAYELIKTLPDKSVDLIVTDPPYDFGHELHGGGVLNGRSSGHWIDIADGKFGRGFDLAILDEFVRVLKKINIYLWCNKEQIYDYLTYFAKERKCNWEMLIWAKENPSPFYGSHYLKDKEYCLYFWETGVKLNMDEFQRSKTVFLTKVSRTDREKYGHPTIKPEAIIEALIRNSSGGGVNT